MNKASFYRKIIDIDQIRDMNKNKLHEMADPITAEQSKELFNSLLCEDFVEPTHYTINKTIELTANQYDDFTNNLMEDRSFIIENKDQMYYDNDTYYCIAIVSKEREWIILVESEGFGYARYCAKIKREA